MHSPWPRHSASSSSAGGGGAAAALWRHWRPAVGVLTALLLLLLTLSGGRLQADPEPLHAASPAHAPPPQALELGRVDANANAAAAPSPLGAEAGAGAGMGAAAAASAPSASGKLAATLRDRVRHVPIQLWGTRSHCGGARLSTAAEQRLRHGSPLPSRSLTVSAGDSFDFERPAALLRLTSDAHGQLHVPYIRADDAAAAALAAGAPLPGDAAAFASLTGALPAGHGASSTFCVADPEELLKERQRVDQHKQAALAGRPDPHLHIDYECMERRWRRCLLLLRLDDPDSLPLQAPPQPWQRAITKPRGGKGRGAGRAARPHQQQPRSSRAQTDAPGEGAHADGDGSSSEQLQHVGVGGASMSDFSSAGGPAAVAAVVRVHSACRGRGECERWTGPMPK